MQLHEMEEQFRNLDERTAALEQKLPLLATKVDLRELREELVAVLASKDDLKAFATKSDLELTTKALQREIAGCATEIAGCATRDELKAGLLAAKDELKAGLEDGKRYTLLLIQATRGEIRQVSQQVASLADDVRGVAAQVATISTHLTGVRPQIPAVKPRKKPKK